MKQRTAFQLGAAVVGAGVYLTGGAPANAYWQNVPTNISPYSYIPESWDPNGQNEGQCRPLPLGSPYQFDCDKSPDRLASGHKAKVRDDSAHCGSGGSVHSGGDDLENPATGQRNKTGSVQRGIVCDNGTPAKKNIFGNRPVYPRQYPGQRSDNQTGSQPLYVGDFNGRRVYAVFPKALLG